MDAAAEDAVRLINAFTEGYRQPYPADHAFQPVLDRLSRTSQRARNLATFLVSVPRPTDRERVLALAADLSRRFDQFSEQTADVVAAFDSVDTIMDNRRNVGQYEDAALEFALQYKGANILRLESAAASGTDPEAKRRFAALVALVYSRPLLASLMNASGDHGDLLNALTRYSGVLARLPEADYAEEDYVHLYQSFALNGVLRAGNMTEARAELADTERELRSQLARFRRQQFLGQIARLFSSDVDPSRASGARVTRTCRKRYAPITVGTDLYSGAPTTFGGEYLGEDCSDRP